MLKKLLIGVGVLVGLVVVVIATRPSSFRIERTTSIQAPPEMVYPILADFHQWERFSPWDKLDPAMTRTFAGAESGVGAVYSWKGNDDVGEGRMTITKVDPPRLVEIKLEFLAPMTATNTTTFVLDAKGDTTGVTWSMTGENNFVGKAFSMMMDMDAMVGADFEKGLAALKASAEADLAARRAEAEAAALAAAAALPAEGVPGEVAAAPAP